MTSGQFSTAQAIYGALFTKNGDNPYTRTTTPPTGSSTGIYYFVPFNDTTFNLFKNFVTSQVGANGKALSGLYRKIGNVTLTGGTLISLAGIKYGDCSMFRSGLTIYTCYVPKT